MLRVASVILAGVITGPHRVVRVIDGDTFVVVLAGKETSVRVLGVDTPESVPPRPREVCGREAAAFTRAFLADAEVMLDVQPGKTTFGRPVAHAWVVRDAGVVSLDYALVRAGWARAWRRSGSAWESVLVSAEARAREGRLGVWDPDANCVPVGGKELR